MSNFRLTQYSHGAGCGCKISPSVLTKILHSNQAAPDNKHLIVGNNTRDDAAVYNLENGNALIATTDFFMPIVDDAFDFGRIAAANAISDIYAMGGKPLLAIAILGWPINILPPEIAQKVIEGGRSVCAEAEIPLAGGHSIDSPEPIFGLAVNGIVPIENIKTNGGAQPGDMLYLTKPMGIGIHTTAVKKGILQNEHEGLAAFWMARLNKIGEDLGKIAAVHAMTDVTGFGLLGHLTEMCEASGLSAELFPDKIPQLPGVQSYIEAQSIPGGTLRNFDSYGHYITTMNEQQKALFCDPQTSGGLLIAIAPESVNILVELFNNHGLNDFTDPIGRMLPRDNHFLIAL